MIFENPVENKVDDDGECGQVFHRYVLPVIYFIVKTILEFNLNYIYQVDTENREIEDVGYFCG